MGPAGLDSRLRVELNSARRVFILGSLLRYPWLPRKALLIEKAEAQEGSPPCKPVSSVCWHLTSHWREQVTWPCLSLMGGAICREKGGSEHLLYSSSSGHRVTVQLSVMRKSQANVSPLSDLHQPRDFWQVTFLLCASVSPPEKQISSGIDC